MEPIDELSLAEQFLRQAVYRSRAAQATGVALQRGAKPSVGQCGLGERAAIELDLDARGRELFEALWPGGVDDAALERVRERTAAWIERQDALDRDRNHFLKAFRGKHGFDRTRYTVEELAEFEAGLAKVNTQEDRERGEAAHALLEAGGRRTSA
jgi:hypothetical protein